MEDRIVLTGLFGYDRFGSPVPELQAVFLPFGADGARFSTNAVNTTTQGLDLVVSYRWLLGKGRLDITLLGNLNATVVDDELNIPEQLAGQEDVYFGPDSRAVIEGNNPQQKVNLSLNYSAGKFTAFLGNVYFGRVTRNGFPFGIEQVHAGKVVTDASVSYEVTKGLQFTLGANNLLNVYPDLQAYENSYFGVFQYAPVQQGFMGGFYFARANFTLKPKK